MSFLGCGLPFHSTSSGIQQSFLCSFCHYLLVQPKVISCGHRYCLLCLKKIMSTDDQPTVCLVNGCNESITNDRIHTDFGTEIDIKNLRNIVCHNQSNGCTWQGDYVSYQDHVQVCTFQRLQCEYCSTFVTNRILYEQHYQICPKAPVPCPLSKIGCDIQIRRETLPDHVLSSLTEHFKLLVDIALQNQSIINSRQQLSIPTISSSSTNDNLDIKSLQNELVKQAKTIEQLRLEQKSLQSKLNKRERDLDRACVNVQLLKGELCDLRKEFQISKTYIHSDGTYLWRIDTIQELFHNAKNASQPIYINSPSFYSSKNGYKLSLKLYLNGDKTAKDTYLSLYITVMCGPYDSLLKWPFSYPITLCLYDRSSKHDHVVHTLTPDVDSECFEQPRMDANKSGGIPEFCPLWKLFSKDYGYVYQDSMFIKAFIDFNIYPTKIWPHWTQLQSNGLPANVEHIKLIELFDNDK